MMMTPSIMKTPIQLLIWLVGVGLMLSTVAGTAQYKKKTVVAHRGASAYAP